MTNDLFQSNLERIARGRIGQQAILNYPTSPYHGQSGTIVDTMTMADKQIVYTVEWPDGIRVSYVPARLRLEGAMNEERITLYEIAAMRVEREPALLPYREVILHEWPEGDEHWNWVIDAPVEEIVEWAATVVGDQPA